jgi:alanyl-tRNA synthetase
MAERLYYNDPFLRKFAARVTEIHELSRVEGQSVWQIALDRTAFYPTSGGQPHDLGFLTAHSRSGVMLEVPIIAVEEDEHGVVWHHVLKPLLKETEVTGEIDWTRRFDHMQQHSGQHLLSAVFLRELGAHTVSFHLGESVSTIDLGVESLASHSMERVERIANEIVAEDRAITIRSVARKEAEALLAAGQLRKLPEREGEIRLIEIADYDLNACGGTHVRSTGQIGGLLLRGIERARQGVRVEFVCGMRAVTAARADYGTMTRSAALLSTPRTEVPAAIEKLLGEVKAAAKIRQKLYEELANYHTARLLVEVWAKDGLRVVRRNLPDRDADYVKLLAVRLTEAAPHTVAVLASTLEEPAFVVVAHSGDLDFHAGQVLKDSLAKMGQRGGGSPTLAQGRLPQEHLPSFFDSLESTIREMTTVASRDMA